MLSCLVNMWSLNPEGLNSLRQLLLFLQCEL